MIQKLPPATAALMPITATLGTVGQTGLTALFGVEEDAKPKAGDVVVVSSAAGAVGSVAAQLCKKRGCFVVGLCGSDEKATWLEDYLGLDVGLNYKSDSFAEDLAAVTPDVSNDGGSEEGGVNVYWDNVGGEISDTVIRLMGRGGHVVLCGQISM